MTTQHPLMTPRLWQAYHEVMNHGIRTTPRDMASITYEELLSAQRRLPLLCRHAEILIESLSFGSTEQLNMTSECLTMEVATFRIESRLASLRMDIPENELQYMGIVDGEYQFRRRVPPILRARDNDGETRSTFGTVLFHFPPIGTRNEESNRPSYVFQGGVLPSDDEEELEIDDPLHQPLHNHMVDGEDEVDSDSVTDLLEDPSSSDDDGEIFSLDPF